MARTTLEICELLDARLAPVLLECRKEMDVDPSTATGAIAGFFLKTGAALAHGDGMGRADLKRVFDRVLTGLYG